MNSVQENVAKSRKIGKFVQEIHSFRFVSMLLYSANNRCMIIFVIERTRYLIYLNFVATTSS